LKQRIAAREITGALRQAIEADDGDKVVSILRAHPEMLHVPVVSGNWGPPMSHAPTLDVSG
jgi:2-oxo-4-hydroxy-4-carboxy--5-ureidoimidazoline (OHCU) decarboxylase